MELRRIIRAILAILPMASICLISLYLVYHLATSESDPPSDLKEIAMFVLGSIAGSAASASAFYFKPDKDE